MFDPIRYFLQRRAADRLTKRLSTMSVRTHHSAPSQRGDFPFPGTQTYLVAERDNQRLGHVDYSVNALRDRVYINKVEVVHQRQGVGLGLLWHLWQIHRLPIVPLTEYELSYGFWDKARSRFGAAGAQLLDQLASLQDLNEEALRWQHLVRESEVEISIRKYWEWVASEYAAGRPAGPGIP